MNTTVAEAAALAEALSQISATVLVKSEALVCPPFINIPTVKVALGTAQIAVGAQNLHQADKGAYTGEVSGAMLAAAGCTYVILGHSERRQYFFETDALVNAKIRQALASQLTPIVCIGETLEERDAGSALEVVKTQVLGALAGLSEAEAAKLVWAYEPVWAIGTGKTATPDQAQAMHQAIRGWLAEAVSASVAEATRILYGGSMNAANAQELLAQPDIDGGLIGGASLKASDFGVILHAAATLS